MQYKLRHLPFKKRKALPLIQAALLLLSSCGSEAIKLSESTPDAEWCSPIFNDQGQVVIAACDWFLESNPETLNSAGWSAKVRAWGVPECTPASNMTALKVFVEDTCSQVTCPGELKAAFEENFERISKLGAK